MESSKRKSSALEETEEPVKESMGKKSKRVVGAKPKAVGTTVRKKAVQISTSKLIMC